MSDFQLWSANVRQKKHGNWSTKHSMMWRASRIAKPMDTCSNWISSFMERRKCTFCYQTPRIRWSTKNLLMKLVSHSFSSFDIRIFHVGAGFEKKNTPNHFGSEPNWISNQSAKNQIVILNFFILQWLLATVVRVKSFARRRKETICLNACNWKTWSRRMNKVVY